LTAWHRFLTHDPGTTEERIRFAREIASIADAELLDDQRLMGRRLLLGDLLEVGAMAEFTEHLDEYASLASDLRRPSHIWWASALAATRASFVGDLDEAQRLAEEARRVGDRLDQSDAIGAYILQSFVVRYQQGRLGEVSSTIETPIEYREAVPSWFALMATFLSETGRHDEARAVIDRLLRRGFETMPRDTFWLASMCLLAGAAAKSGATGAIGALESRLSPYADRFVVFGAGGAVLGVVHHWLGLLAAADGRRRDAEAHLTMAFRASTLAMSEFWAQRAEDLLLGPYER
jgi:hypothetical protein